MQLSRAMVRHRLALGLVSAIVVALWLPSCSTIDESECQLVGGRGEWQDGVYRVLVVVENGSEKPLAYDEIGFEITAFDEEDNVLLDRYPHRLKGPDIAPFDQDRAPLILPDRDGRVCRCLVYMTDRRGRVISELEIPATSASDT